MARIHFSLPDLARVRLATRPFPQLEALFAVQRLQDAEGAVLFDGWRRQVRRPTGAGPPALRRLFDLVPRPRATAQLGTVPSFLVPLVREHEAEQWLDLVRSTPPRTVRTDLAEYARTQNRPLPGWLRDLADRGRDEGGGLADALRSFLRTAIEPIWPQVVASVEAERAVAAQHLLDGGLDRLFDRLPGVLRWQPPMLFTWCPVDQDIPLAGRGLLIVPSYFCWRWPVVAQDLDSSDPVVLVYPARHRPLALPGDGPATRPGGPLAAALGSTRAAVLELVADAATTGGLARRLGISPATVSWHVAALREAGLITTQRNRYAIHRLTERGRQLAEPPAGPGFRASSNLWTTTP